MKFIFIVLLNFCIIELLVAKLVQVHVLFRHGDRAPLKSFPADINKQNVWKNGIGQLTDLGIRQQVGFGKWLWRRYLHFIGTKLNNSVIHVRSTNTDRTLMSAESNLAGMYYNNPDHVINNFKWHPVPIHTESKKNDIILKESSNCPKYRPLWNKTPYEEPYKSRLAKYDDVLKLLRSKSGIKNLKWTNFWYVYDTVFCEKANNLAVNSWITPDLWKKMTEITNILWELNKTGKIPRMGAGVLLKVIADRMSAVVHPNKKTEFTIPSPTKRFFIYSGHDTNVAPLAMSLIGDYGKTSFWQPPYASAVFVELHKNPWRVKVMYKNYTQSDGDDESALKYRTIVGCNKEDCPFEKFMKVVKPKMVSKSGFKSLCF